MTTETLSPWALMRRRFQRHRFAVFSLWLLTALYAAALLAEPLAPYAPEWRDLDYAFCPPQLPRFSWRQGLLVYAMRQRVDPVTFKKSYDEDFRRPVPLVFFVRGHLLGTAERGPPFFFLGADKYGRDIFSRLIFGARISLSVGLIAVALSSLFGVIAGGISGYVGGGVDNAIQRLIEIVNSFPQIPLWLALAAIVPAEWSPLATYFAVTLVLSLLGWTNLARVVRGKILALREEEYAMAARLMGASHARILFRHLLPGTTSHIIVVLTLTIPAMILGETSLSFLGLGLRPPVVSWGVMLQDCFNIQTVAHYPWLLSPMVVLVVTVLAFNFLGDGLRDASDPYV